MTDGTITAAGSYWHDGDAAGTAAAIETALAAATYTGGGNFYGPDTLTLTTTDGGGHSSGPKSFAMRLADTAVVTETLTGVLSGAEQRRSRWPG